MSPAQLRALLTTIVWATDNIIAAVRGVSAENAKYETRSVGECQHLAESIIKLSLREVHDR